MLKYISTVTLILLLFTCSKNSTNNFGLGPEESLDTSPPISANWKTKSFDGPIPYAKQAMWVWHEEDFFDNSEELIEFASQFQINMLFCQMDETFKVDKWKTFIRLAHSNNIEVHLLDGWKYYSVPENHETLLGKVDLFLNYNSTVDENEKFDGLHHDNEPHGQTEFTNIPAGVDPLDIQIPILSNYLELTKKVQDRVSGIVPYGVDIAFWYDIFEIDFDGNNRLLSEHLIGMVDLVTIMDYRRFASGVDGIVYHATNELHYAQSIGMNNIMIGVETGENMGADPPKITFFYHEFDYMKGEIFEAASAFNVEPAFQGFSIHYYRPFRDLLNKD